MSIAARKLADLFKAQASAIEEARASTPSKATVTRVEDGVTYVKFPGAEEETPLDDGMGAREGEQVLVDRGTASVVANGSTSIRLEEAEDLSYQSQAMAAAARSVAEATGQHLWSADDGLHVTDTARDAYEAAAGSGFDDLDPVTKPYNNVLMNSLGQLFRRGDVNLLALLAGNSEGQGRGVAVYDGEGNASQNIVGSFGKDGVEVGAWYRVRIVSDGMHVVDPLNVELAAYGDQARIGQLADFHIVTTSTQMEFHQGETLAGYVSNNELNIPNAVIGRSMRIGDWAWVREDDGNLSLVWIGDDA